MLTSTGLSSLRLEQCQTQGRHSLNTWQITSFKHLTAMHHVLSHKQNLSKPFS